MVCKQCGAYSESGMKFCTVCGAMLNEKGGAQVLNAAELNTDEPAEGERPNRRLVRI